MDVTTAQNGSYARRCQDGRTFSNQPGPITPAYPLRLRPSRGSWMAPRVGRGN